jgi:hypothetical protein
VKKKRKSEKEKTKQYVQQVKHLDHCGPLSFLPPGHEVGVPSSETLKSLEDVGCTVVEGPS